jgi:hypothetical protein
MSLTAGPSPSPPTPPTPPPAVSCEVAVGIWPCSPTLMLGPFCFSVSLTITWRCTVLPLRPAVMVTRPPALPVGANKALFDGPAGMVATLPRSTPQPTATGWPFRVASYFTVGVVWPAVTVMVWSAVGSTSKPWTTAPPLPELVVNVTSPPVPPLCEAPLPALLLCDAPVPPVPVVKPCVLLPLVLLPLLPQAAEPAATVRERKRAEPRFLYGMAIVEMYRATGGHCKRGRAPPQAHRGESARGMGYFGSFLMAPCPCVPLIQ